MLQMLQMYFVAIIDLPKNESRHYKVTRAQLSLQVFDENQQEATTFSF